MAKCFAGGHLRYVDGEWRDDDGRTVDAVEVVRCYKCKHWEPMNKGFWMNRNRTDGVCRTLMEFRLSERYLTEKDHFCGYGERRKENEVD